MVGSEKMKNDIMKKVESSPLTLSGCPMKMVTQEKYLGDYIHISGNPGSVLATVKAKMV